MTAAVLTKPPAQTSSISAIRHPHLGIAFLPGKGRGVIATGAISQGELLEIAPVLPLSPGDMPLLRQTALWPYWFEWKDPSLPHGEYRDTESQKDSTAPQAIILGLITLLNHSDTPNADYDYDFARLVMTLTALRGIAAGEEITINYHCLLWFEQQA